VRIIGSYLPYATIIFHYVRRAMPYTESKSLINDEFYAVTAYLLHLNGIIEAQDVMNAHTLPQVKMQNHDEFMVVYPAKPKQIRGSLPGDRLPCARVCRPVWSCRRSRR
jgi:S-disulfanyl-L-cysteine oxidoreductase SoxD